VIAFDVSRLKAQIHELETQMAVPGFWEDRARSKTIAQQLDAQRAKLQRYQHIEHQLQDLEVLAGLAQEEGDSSALREVETQAQTLARQIDQLELEIFMSGPYDNYACYLSLNAGAGGTDAQDWAELLLRMYVGWLERRGYRYRVLEASPGEVAGLKSATVEVQGPYAYGYLKGEQGVHRLVRISPYDANQRRHTSFAAVSVIPIIEDADVEIRDDDLKIDTYRSGGAGGQYVNKTESAVRITHLPTGVVVACQKERSQHQNKEIAMKMLKARLYELQRRERERGLEEIRGEQKSIEWGSQIRSYVFHPYQLVKDHRTDVETGRLEAVMNGEIDEFIEAYLRQPATKS
jgi:peptide chain release factor 2